MADDRDYMYETESEYSSSESEAASETVRVR